MTSAEFTAPRPNPALLSILSIAYQPCPNFDNCREAVWRPKEGHAPRGFLGATGKLRSVEVIMVFAEPGHPHSVESYDSALPPKDMAMQTVEYVYQCFKHGKDLFHRNTRWFMDQLWPDISFDRQLEKVWLTESRLCSISDEIGHFRDQHCAAIYLAKQIELMPDASVIAFGGKSQKNITSVVPTMISAFALSPPGANQKRARPSWEAAISEVLSRRSH